MSLRRAGRVLGAMILSLLLFLVLFEVAVRAYLNFATIYDVEMSRYAVRVKQPSPNPRIGHVHRPGVELELMDVPVRINSAGLRDEEYPLERTGKPRLVFLGDSLTFGWGVAKEETFEARLERQLAPLEILNFGTGNYNTEQQVNLFLEKGLGYRPDGVVVFYFINDAEVTPSQSGWRYLGFSRAVTFFWSRIQNLRAQRGAGRSFSEYYSALYDEEAEGWIRARRAFADLAAACRQQDMAVGVVLLPDLHTFEPYPFAAQHRMVAGYLDELGIPHRDLLPAFSGEPRPRRLWVADDDAHPNAAAHEIIARSSLDFLKEILRGHSEAAPQEET